MKTIRQQASGRIRIQISRVLAGALLVGIISSAIVGVAHSHASVLSAFESSVSANITRQLSVSPESPLSTRSDGNQCLTCVLHRQFSSSLVHSPFVVAELPATVDSGSAAITFSYSNTLLSPPIARHSGRAPPLCQA